MKWNFSDKTFYKDLYLFTVEMFEFKWINAINNNSINSAIKIYLRKIILMSYADLEQWENFCMTERASKLNEVR